LSSYPNCSKTGAFVEETTKLGSTPRAAALLTFFERCMREAETEKELKEKEKKS
jgi:hypothetical protein